MDIARWDDSVIPCPKCRADVSFPVVYGNVIEKRTGSYVQDPFTRLLLGKSADREARDKWIALCDYVMITLDGDDLFDVFADLKSALALGKPVFLVGTVPSGLSKKVNLPIPPPSTRKRKLETALKDELLSVRAKQILELRVRLQSSGLYHVV